MSKQWVNAWSKTVAKHDQVLYIKTGGKHTYQNDASYTTSHILDTDTSENLDASTSLYLWLTPD